jgi:hypothetical protein
MLRHCRLVLVLLAVGCLAAARVSAGQDYTRQDVAVGVVSETAALYNDPLNTVGPTHLFAGPVGRYTWNLSPSLAVEGSVGYLPGFQTSYGTNNGHELLALGGIKAGWRGRRFGVYGKAEPGISSWTPGLQTFGPAPKYPLIYSRRTDFTLDMGGVLEYYPTPRTIVRLDAGTTMIADYDQVLLREPGSGGSLEIIEPGHIAQHLAVGLSVAHRFGEVHEEQEREPARSPLDAGILFSLQQRVHQEDSQILPNRGGGAWLSYNFSRYVSLDGTAFYSPQDDHYDFPQDGGRDFMAVGGIKAGIRGSRMGYFVTARPGMIQFSRTVDFENLYAKPPVIRWEKTTDYVADLGGAVEVYAAKHFLFRADVGNATVHYHAANLFYTASARTTLTPRDIYYPPLQRPSILTQFGFGWRF